MPQLFIEVKGAFPTPAFVLIGRAVPRTAGMTGKSRQENFSLEIQMLSIFRRLMNNEYGATAIEYTLIASLIAVAAIVAMRAVGGSISNTMSNVASTMG
jgi:pilus assembly protein Flp/PilA